MKKVEFGVEFRSEIWYNIRLMLGSGKDLVFGQRDRFVLEVRDIGFSYYGERILKGVSFVVSPGESVCIVGGNGAGKTTLMRVLSTLAVAESGKILVDGKDALAKVESYRKNLGYLPEEIGLYDDMTVKEYLLYRAKLKGEGMRRLRRLVKEAAEVCLLGEKMRVLIRDLSLGYRKRVALADVIMLRPRLVLLDDFLAGLDHEMRVQAREILSNVAAFSSVVMTGHEVEDLALSATRFLVLKGGVIAGEVVTAGMESAAVVEKVNSLLEGEG